MSVVIVTPSFEKAMRRIAECHRSYGSAQGPRHLRLLGQTGVGKTFVLLQYVDEHPQVQGSDRTVVPVLFVPIPSAPTLKGLYQAILKALGVDGAVTNNLESLRHRVITLIRNLHVELLLLDELNHLVDRGKRRSHEAVADGIKQLVDSIGIPTIFAGALRSKRLFDANAQLRSRVTATHTLRPFDLEKSFRELQGFIAARLQPSHPAPQCEWMSAREQATRLFFATDGLPRQVAEFLDVVPVWSSTQSKTPEKFLGTLKQLFVDELWESAPDERNPFSHTFDWRRLCAPGEPYEPNPLDGDNHLES